MENGETTAQAALRETLEEAGAEVELGAPFSMISVPYVNQVHLFYRARLRELDFKPGEETLEVALWDEDKIPWQDIAFRTVGLTPQALVRRPRARRFRLPRRGPTIKLQQQGGWTMKVLIGLLAVYAPAVLAQAPAAAPKLDPANTAWMITASVLVLFMTLPGLALFYAGLVRTKNVLSVLMQCFAITCIVTLAWLVIGYSIASATATPGGAAPARCSSPDRGRHGQGQHPRERVRDVPDDLRDHHAGAGDRRLRRARALRRHAALQPALAADRVLPARALGVGRRLAAEERPDGLRRRHGGAPERRHGGAGLRAGPRPPARLPRDADGAAQHDDGGDRRGDALVRLVRLQRGSALAADGAAGMAMLVTHIGAATGAFAWMICEWLRYEKPSVLGIVTGMVAGLGHHYARLGFVGPIGAL
jgi:Amt family ammonium transporter